MLQTEVQRSFTLLHNKNVILLAKWWSRYNNNIPSMWKCVIQQHYGSSLPMKLTATHNIITNRKMYDILSLQRDEFLQAIIGEHTWKWRFGKGDQVEFWADNWLTEIPLKRKYPDLYLIADNPFGKVLDFYSIQGLNLICWSIRFKRILSAHEKTQLEEVLLRLGETGIQHQQPHMVFWSLLNIYSTWNSQWAKRAIR